jgi:hypothetical protein
MKLTVFGLVLLLALSFFSSCRPHTKNEGAKTSSANADSAARIKDSAAAAKGLFREVYSAKMLPSQLFRLQAEKGITLHGKDGTVIHIPASAFCYAEGKIVKGSVQIELKEALHPLDMVMANLTTIRPDGSLLESGGMLYLNATADDKPLQLAPGKSIGLNVPATASLPGMEYYTGNADTASGKIAWVDPQPLAPQFEIAVVYPVITETNETSAPGDTTYKVHFKLRSGFDSIAGLEGGSVALNRPENKKFKKAFLSFTSKDSSTNGRFEGNSNWFTEDNKTNYIFSMKKLGWANIDRLMDDPRTQPVALRTEVKNHDSFPIVYISMIVKNKQMYIPGYQKKDGSYFFTHGDYEETRLPVGEKALILATAYKDNKPYIATQKITISPKQTLSFSLEETTTQALKEQLAKEL